MKKRVIQLFGVLGAICGFAMFCLENSFIWSPTKPQLGSGEIVPYTYKGILHFITRQQFIEIKTIYFCFWATAVIFGSLVVLEAYKRGWPGKSKVRID